jgi:hypothetical protein
MPCVVWVFLQSLVGYVRLVDSKIYLTIHAPNDGGCYAHGLDGVLSLVSWTQFIPTGLGNTVKLHLEPRFGAASKTQRMDSTNTLHI